MVIDREELKALIIDTYDVYMSSTDPEQKKHWENRLWQLLEAVGKWLHAQGVDVTKATLDTAILHVQNAKDIEVDPGKAELLDSLKQPPKQQ